MKLIWQNINSTLAALLPRSVHRDQHIDESRKNTAIKTALHPVFRRSAVFILLILICGIFVGEALADLLATSLNPDSQLLNTLIDSALLIVTVFPLLYLFVFRPFKDNITERTQSEEKIKLKNEQLNATILTKDKFFSIIAHDLRGPLGTFTALTEMLAGNSQDFTPDQKKEMTLNMSHSARNIFNLLENLLEWSQIQQGNIPFNPRVLDLKKIIIESIKALTDSAGNKAIELTVDVSGDQQVFADANMFQTVIRNLVSNAIKFTPRGGKVTISATREENNTDVIAVKDTGIGIPHETLAGLFRLDAKSNRKGTEGESSTGLGLLLCKDFIEKHGGKIWVESEEGKGSVFYFTLPSGNSVDP